VARLELVAQRRNDLPHDQVADDNDGVITGEFDGEADLQELAPDGFGRDVDGLAEELVEPPEDEGVGEEPNRYTEADFDEETASEVASGEVGIRNDEDTDLVENADEGQVEEGGTALGWTGLVLSILSLFFLPVLMATAGIVTGFFAYRSGARTLGLWAIGIGAVALIIGLFFVPFVVR
jgi:hypothetical protein